MIEKRQIFTCFVFMSSTKILFLVPYPLQETPSQRFRFEEYFFLLDPRNISYRVQSFLTGNDWRAIYSPGNYRKKFTSLFGGFMRRFFILFSVPAFDYIFIHREATPAGPPVIEWLIAKVFRKKIIYDFDDAIWATDKTRESWSERFIKWRSKIGSVISWSHRVSAGNEYLCDYARKFTSPEKVVLNPTTIETDLDYNRELYPIKKDPERIVIGWTGSRSTLKYMRQLMPVLQEMVARFPQVDIVFIADQDDGQQAERFYFRKWSAQTEINDLLSMDIGIMPLPEDPWANGKCGLKALQYMALEIPSVISPVGVNQIIVKDGVNGFLCRSADEWLMVLTRLVENSVLRKQVGRAGRDTVVNTYSVKANAEIFLSLFHR